MTISSGTYSIGTGQTYATWTAFAADIAAGALTGQLIGEGAVNEDLNETVTFSGFTTTAANNLILRAQSAVAHNGNRGSGHRIWSNALSGQATLSFDGVMHWTVEDLEVVQEDSGAAIFRQIATTAAVNGAVVVRRVLGFGDRDGDTTNFSTVIDQDGTWTDFDSMDFENSLFVGCNSTGLRGGGTDAIVRCNYVTLIKRVADSDVSASGFRDVTAHNCVAMHFGPSGGHADFLGNDATSSNNASSDASGDTTSVVIADAFSDVGAATYDFHLKSGSVLIGAGANISGITTDVDGDTRHATAPDIGFDELVAGGATGQLLSQIGTHGMNTMSGGFRK